MMLRHFIIAFAVAGLVAGCGSGQVKRITPSVVTIQQLVAAPDGQWRVTLRVQNYSTVAMHYSAMHVAVFVASVDVGSIDLNPDLDIPANSADVVDATIRATAKLPVGDLDYKIAGTIDTSEPKGSFKVDRSGRLSPAPGLPGTWR